MKETRPPHTTPWRFCASCAGTLVCWAVWIVLGITLAWQGFVAVSRDLTVPDIVLRRIESTLAAENFYVRFGRAHLDPRGGILLEKVQLHSRSFDEPLLTSDFLYLRKSIWSVLAGQTLPDVVRLEGASIQLPAMFSPSGTAEPLLRDVNADFRLTDKLWSVERLTGQIGHLPLSITGNTAPPRTSGGLPLSVAEITRRYFQFAREIILALPGLQAVEQPVLEVACTPRETGGMDLTLNFTAAAVRRPGGEPLELGPLFLEGKWAWDGLKPSPLLLELATRSVVAESFNASNILAQLKLEPGTGGSLLGPIHGKLTASRLQTIGETINVPVLEGSYRPDRKELKVTTAFNSHGRVLGLDGAVDFAAKSGLVHFSGTVEPTLVTGLLTRYRPKLEPYFRFQDPVWLDARLKLNAGWKFGGVWSWAHTGRLDSHGVQITSARGRADVDADFNFLAHDAHVIVGKNWARGMYWMNFRSMDYRFLLTGQMMPPDISGWFPGNWWPKFWTNFAFRAAPPQADVDVTGNWIDGRNMTYFGSADAPNPEVLHADFERARVRIFFRPQFTHVMDIVAVRAGGAQQATGWFKRTARPGPAGSANLTFDLTGNLDAPTLQKLGGETAVSLLAPFALSQPPQLHLWGRSGKNNPQNESDLQFTGSVDSPLKYFHFPLDRVNVRGKLLGDTLRLEHINLSVAGGNGQGQATLTGPATNRHLTFELKMTDADLARTIRAVEEFEAERTGIKSESLAESKFIKRASGGKLELVIAAQGNPETPTRLKGEGTLKLTGAELPEINLFGQLSQVLRFSSLQLDEARSSFQMADGRVFFPDVRVTGKSALIDAKGSYSIDTKNLDFTAHLKPFEATNNPLTAVLGVLLFNPLVSMFELQLTGQISNPNWSVTLGASTPRLFEPEKNSAPPTPAEAPSPTPVLPEKQIPAP